jgi:hypothetical protein
MSSSPSISSRVEWGGPAGAGNSNQKRAPLPQLALDADIAAHQFDQAAEMARPRPVPPCSRLRAASICEKRANISA